MHSNVTSKNVSGFTLAGPPCIVAYPEVDERSVVERDLRQSTAMSCGVGIAGGRSRHHADTLGENVLQLRRSSARYQRPYQRHRVLVEVRLSTNTPQAPLSLDACGE